MVVVNVTVPDELLNVPLLAKLPTILKLPVPGALKIPAAAMLTFPLAAMLLKALEAPKVPDVTVRLALTVKVPLVAKISRLPAVALGSLMTRLLNATFVLPLMVKTLVS